MLGGGVAISLEPGGSAGATGCAEQYYRIVPTTRRIAWSDQPILDAEWNLLGWTVEIAGGVCEYIVPPPPDYNWTCALNGTWSVRPALPFGVGSDVVDVSFFGARCSRSIEVYANVPTGSVFCGGFHRPEITGVIARAHIAGIGSWTVSFPAASMCDAPATTQAVVDLGSGHTTTLTCTLTPVLGP